MVPFWKKHPTQAALDIFGDQSLPLDHEDRFDLDAPQRIVINSAWVHNYAINILSRGSGKTFVDSVLAMLFALLVPGNRIGLVSSSFRQCPFMDLPYLPIFTSRGMTLTPRAFYDSINPGDCVAAVKKPCRIVNKWINPAQDGFIITTERGFTIGGINEHRVMVAGPDLTLDYKTLAELDTSDWIAIKRGSMLFGNNNTLPPGHVNTHWASNEVKFPSTITPDLAYWFGLVQGDGHIRSNTKSGRYEVALTSADDDLVAAFRRIAYEQFGLVARNYTTKGRKAAQWSINSKPLIEWMLSLGFTNNGALTKRTPDPILTSSSDCVAAYLSGLFDTDGGGHQDKDTHSYTLGFSTSSPHLANETRAMLLNFGILAALSLNRKGGPRILLNRTKASNCATSYKVRFTSQTDLRLFQKFIGYRCERKRHALEQHLARATSRMVNADMIPYVREIVLTIIRQIKAATTKGHRCRLLVRSLRAAAATLKTDAFGRERLLRLLEIAKDAGVDTADTKRLRQHLDLNISFVRLKSKVPHRAPTFDIEVDDEHCYVAGGFVNHNSKFIWDEIQKLYEISPMVQEACVDTPKVTPEKCYLRFKAAPGKVGSVIEALPMGSDGGKIRGARYFVVLCDEMAQIDPEVFDVVIRGFTATKQNPMKHVKKIRRLRRELAEGLITEEDVMKQLESGANKVIGSSTAFYQYNHLWERVTKLIESTYGEHNRNLRRKEPVDRFTIKGGPLNGGQIPARFMSNGKQALCAFQYTDMSEGFIDLQSIETSRTQMSDYQWKMEYCLVPGTEIITPFGLRPIEKIQEGDLVLTHRGRFRPVVETMMRYYKGPVTEMTFAGYNRPIKITEGHHLWQGEDQWVESQNVHEHSCLADLQSLNGQTIIDLLPMVQDPILTVINGKEYIYPRPSQYVGPLQRKGRKLTKPFKCCVHRRMLLNKDLGLIFGYYAAEGNTGAANKAVVFSLDGHHDVSLQRLVLELSGAIERAFGRTPKVYNRNNVNCVNVCINSRIIAGFIKSVCPGDSKSKRMDPKVLFSNSDFLRGFIQGYWHGDGCLNTKPQAIAGAIGRDLLSQVRLALSYFGFPSGLRDTAPAGTAVIEGRTCHTQPVQSVEIKGDDARRFAKWLDGTQMPDRRFNCGHIQIWHHQDHARLKLRHRNVIHYEGQVYNLKVADDNSYSTPGCTVHNCSFFPADSEGFYRRSLLDAARKHAEFGPVLAPRKGCLYSMGIDPARTDDNFAIAIYEVEPGLPDIRLVRVQSWNKKDFPYMADQVRQLIRHYKITYFKMDSGGGGTTVRDLLAKIVPPGEKPILEQDFEEHKMLVGDRILGPLVQFSSYEWVHDTNHNLKAALQNGTLKIASVPPVPGHVTIWTPEIEEADAEIETALAEWSSVVTTATGSRIRWDTPSKNQRKDRYSAILIGYDAAATLLARHDKPAKLVTGSWL